MSTLMSNVEFSILRFDPDKDKVPYMQNYTLSIPAGKDLMLLAALKLIKAELDETLSFRHSCGEGVCGSDGLNINGKNGLACITSISTLKQPIVIRPLPGMPIIRDLVVDMEPFYAQYRRVEPWLQNDETPAPAKERLQMPEERAKLDGLYECILCACCTTSCPSFWWNRGDPDRFIGPAGLLWADRFLSDSRDNADQERLEKLGDPYSLFSCRTIMNCASVCPKDLNPAKAIREIKDKLINNEG